METRTERFAKYRDFIKRLPSDAFEPDGTYAEELTAEELHHMGKVGYSSSSITISSKVSPSRPALDIAPDDGKATPYSLYLKKKQTWWIIKVIVAAVVIGLFVMFYFLFVKGA